MIEPTPKAVLDFVHDTSTADLPLDVRRFAQRCLLDLLGVAAAGRTTELSSVIGDHAVAHFGAGAAASPILFDGRMVSPAGAALAAGMTIDSIDAHDGHKITKGHSGCHQLAALLAFTTAERNTDPAAFLTSLVVGYEVATRAGVALHTSVPDYHSSGSWGAVGAAALGARVLGLDHARSAEALGIAEYHGPRSQMMRVIDHPTMLKDGSGWGAMAGVSAAYLAQSGFTGAPAITLTAPEVVEVWADLGTHWVILDQYFKPHPVCRWAQPAVEAALGLRQAHGFTSVEVTGVEVTTFHEAARLACVAPSTTEQAQYSLPFPVAAAIARGRVGPAEVGPDALVDSEILRLSELVVVSEDDRHNRAFPGNRFARVTVELSDGSRLESPDTEPRGDPEAHLADAELHNKFFAYAEPVLGDGRADALAAAVDGLWSAASLEALFELVFSPR